MDLPALAGAEISFQMGEVARYRIEHGGFNQAAKTYVRRPKIASTLEDMPQHDSPGLRRTGSLRRTVSAAGTTVKKTLRWSQNLLFGQHVDNVELHLTKKSAQSTPQEPDTQSTPCRDMDDNGVENPAYVHSSIDVGALRSDTCALQDTHPDMDIEKATTDLQPPVRSFNYDSISPPTDDVDTATPGPPAAMLPVVSSQKRKHPNDEGDESLKDWPKSRSKTVAASKDLHGMPPIKEKNQDIIDWMDEQPETAELVECNTSPQVGFLPRSDSGARSVQFGTGHDAILPIEHRSSSPLQVESLGSPFSSVPRAGSQDPRMRCRF